MKLPGAVALPAFLALVLTAPTTAAAQYAVLTCESKGDRRQECRVPGLDRSSVTVEEKLSESACVSGSSWGTTGDAIWVSRGCRARFGYVTRGNSSSARPSSQSIRCDSHDREWVHCDVDRVRDADVSIRSANSECSEPKAWGVDDDGIWVRSDCRATFRVRYRN